MKRMSMLVFFGIFFAVYGLINYYIFIHGWWAIPAESSLRTVYLALFLFLSLAFIAGRFLERVWISPLSATLVWTGSFWLAAMLYLFLAVAAIDLLRLANAIIPFFPSAVVAHGPAVRFTVMLSISGATLVLIVAGHVNTLFPRVLEHDLSIAKRMEGEQSMTIVAASDIHLGTIIGRSRLRTLVEKINSLKADLVLFPGDIVDEDLGPVIDQNLGETLRSIRAKLGVYAITGNHEYIGGADAACAYLTEHGITMLRDSAAKLANGVWLVGREDRSSRQFGGARRKELDTLMAGVDASSPVILMDHQPFRLEEGAGKGVDLQLSGHTHHGQIWPLNYVTGAVYELSRGYLRKGNTHVIVSNGVGTWGPPVRLGNRPEILLLRLHFDGPSAAP
jgi:predicted MPP superfamily phosphohydrolase